MIAMVSVLLEGLLIASVARGPAVALGLPGFRETVEGSVVEVGLMLETYEFGDFLHRRCIEVLARGKESKAMLLAVGAEVPLFYFAEHSRYIDIGNQVVTRLWVTIWLPIAM